MTSTCVSCIDSKRVCDRKYATSTRGKRVAKKKRRRAQYALDQKNYNRSRRRRVLHAELEARLVAGDDAARKAAADRLLALLRAERRGGARPEALPEVLEAFLRDLQAGRRDRALQKRIRAERAMLALANAPPAAAAAEWPSDSEP